MKKTKSEKTKKKDITQEFRDLRNLIEENNRNLNERIEESNRGLGALIEENNHRIQAIGEQFSGLNSKIDALELKIDSHAEMIGKLMIDVNIIKADMEIIKGSLRRKVDYEEFAELAKRVSAIESKIRN